MSRRDSYPAGVPCWVETLHQDPQQAAAFYGPLLGCADPGDAAFSISQPVAPPTAID